MATGDANGMGSDVVGVPSADVARVRDRLADLDVVFGAERVFPAAISAMLDEVPDGARVLEVGAATGLLTRPLLTTASSLTAMEISAGMLVRLLETGVADDARLTTLQGVVEDLPVERAFDVAVVTFTPRRGVALTKLLSELALRVTDRVVMLLDDDTSMDWAYLARSAAADGFDVRLRLVRGEPDRRAVLLTASLTDAAGRVRADSIAWSVDAREIDVPYPAPRGTATTLMRYFLGRGDRAALVRTEGEGLRRLYGALRTAAHRMAREEVGVHLHAHGILLVRMPSLDGEGRVRTRE